MGGIVSGKTGDNWQCHHYVKALECTSLGELPDGAWSQFREVSMDVEVMLVRAFGAEKFNYLALMMIDPEVHFHVIPRYSKPVYFLGEQFIDPDWPHATKRMPLDISPRVKKAIEQHLLETIKK